MSKIITFPASIYQPDPIAAEPVATLTIDEFIARIAARQAAAKPIDTTPRNRFGVKVGDIFVSSWGYDQTNVDFFQVVALCGQSSVRVREVNPPLVEEDATGPMAAKRTYRVADLPLLPPVSSSIFIRDQEHGDLKRLQSYDGVTYPTIKVSSYASARLCTGDTTVQYESWYH